MKAMVKHLYIVVDCKTDNCKAAHVLLHLGEKGHTPPRVDYWMGYPLIIECPICGKIYDYSDSEEMFSEQELPAPPTGHIDRLPRSS
jgi:hypothetical protein